jgi:hypothetical protein
MPKKTNNIFTPKDIFDFSHPRFDTVKTQSKGSGLEGKLFGVVVPKSVKFFMLLTKNYDIL